MVEIFPGVNAELRRAQETKEAIADDFIMPTACMACSSQDLFVIADVKYIVCPRCRTIGPVEGDCFNIRPADRRGLGLGFTGETLYSMQAEIFEARCHASAPNISHYYR